MRSTGQKVFQGRFFLVTGGSSGIGLALSAALLEREAKVFIVGLHPESVESALSRLGGRGQRLDGLACDIGVRDSVEKMAGAVLRDHGVPDVIVNNAGFATYRTFEQSDSAEVERLMDVNFGGAIRVTKEFVAGMIQRRSGQIVNVASVAGALKLTPNGLYCACKHGMLAWSQCLDLELRRYGVSVGVVCPGRVETPFFDHETFRTRRHRKETELSVPMAQVAMAWVLKNPVVALAWLAGALGPPVQNRLDRLMLSRIEDLYRESDASAGPQPLGAKDGVSQ